MEAERERRERESEEVSLRDTEGTWLHRWGERQLHRHKEIDRSGDGERQR